MSSKSYTEYYVEAHHVLKESLKNMIAKYDYTTVDKPKLYKQMDKMFSDIESMSCIPSHIMFAIWNDVIKTVLPDTSMEDVYRIYDVDHDSIPFDFDTTVNELRLICETYDGNVDSLVVSMMAHAPQQMMEGNYDRLMTIKPQLEKAIRDMNESLQDEDTVEKARVYCNSISEDIIRGVKSMEKMMFCILKSHQFEEQEKRK